MKIPVVKQCCCGCSLETGTVIIGWLGIVFSIMTVVGGIIGLVSGNSGGHQTSTGSNAISILSGLFMFMVAVILLIGVKKRIPRNVHIWVIVTTISLIINLIAYVAQGCIVAARQDAGAGISIIIATLIFVAIGLYLVIVVNSYKKEISSENQHV